MRLVLRVILLMLAPVALCGATALENAWRAQSMLGAETWSRVIRVQNRDVGNGYPSVVDALVFEQGGILWFYTDSEGTQSLSLFWNRLAEDKKDLGPLLTAIAPGFWRFEVLPDTTTDLKPSAVFCLPNGCFIECLAAWRRKVFGGDRAERPRLLSCYSTTAKGLRGHTVLTFETPEGFFLLDPTVSRRPQAAPREWKEEPMTLAGLVMEGAPVLKARWVSVDETPPVLVARAGPSRAWNRNATPHVMQ